MTKRIFVIRHCQANGQQREAELSEEGEKQAYELANFFANKKVERIISSPFLRAKQSIKPLSERLSLDMESDERLSERILSSSNLSDWYEKLKETFEDLELKFAGGESSQEAMNRIVNVIEDV
ncbi:histidine phosphatase family protein [Bacillus carboniphilus]|uniref:histidine phosphatase family protein n=1 Tax=Bacillus carboniphilus TaxID=86663 RepID=UPI00353279AE